MGRLEKANGYFYFYFYFFSFVIWGFNEYFFSRKYLIKINIFFGEWKFFSTQKFHLKILTKKEYFFKNSKLNTLNQKRK